MRGDTPRPRTGQVHHIAIGITLFLLVSIGPGPVVSMGYASEERYGVDRIMIDRDQWKTITPEEWQELEQALKMVSVLNTEGKILPTPPPRAKDEGDPIVLGLTIAGESAAPVDCAMSDLIVAVTTTVCTIVLRSPTAALVCPLIAEAARIACDGVQG